MAINYTSPTAVISIIVTVVVGIFALLIVAIEQSNNAKDLVHDKFGEVMQRAQEAVHIAKTARPFPYTSKDRLRDAALQRNDQKAAIDALGEKLILRMRLDMAELEAMIFALERPPKEFAKKLEDRHKAIERRLTEVEIALRLLKQQIGKKEPMYGPPKPATMQ